MTDEIRNDSQYPIEQVTKHLNDVGVDICYGEMRLRVERRALDNVRARVATYTPEQRRHSMASVDVALRRALPKMIKGHFSKKTADNFCADVMLWEALRSSRS